MGYSIVVVDDDAFSLANAKGLLSDEDMHVVCIRSGNALLRYLEKNVPDLILLDIMMPGMDGIQAMARIRERSNIPIILLTAKSEDADKILGLNVGADDYITKPFNPLEVTARVRSQLRRYLRLGGGAQNPETYCIGGVELNDAAKAVKVDGEPAALTRTEYEILKLFMANPGRV